MSEDIKRKVPFSLEAEQSVLGAVLIKPESMDDVVGIVKASDFYLEEHKEIFSVMQGMYLKSRNIDVVTLIDELVKNGVYDEAGGREYISVIADTVPTASNVKDYAKIVRDKSILRALIDACEESIEEAYLGEEDTKRILEAAEKRIYSISEQHDNHEFVHIRDALMLAFNRLKSLEANRAEAIGMQTGFEGLDKILVGMGKGDLVLVGARPGMGKTSFVLNVAVNTALRSDKAICIFSLEMSDEQLATRLLSSEALVDSPKLRDGRISDEDWDKLSYSASRLAGCNILINDTGGMTVTGMKSQLRRIKNLGLIVIDYLGLMQSEKRAENKVQEIAEISRSLKMMAKEFGVPIITCAQLSRAPEKRPDNRPALSDLRDSGAIEQDADIVMFIYRPGEYAKDDPEKQNKAEIIIAKNRHGSQGKVDMRWQGQFTKFLTIQDNGLKEP
ncbi:MAG: replicative DNA helicase [Clostridia bacterium]|nr:replicative DNA helicase [Clostridia bacterium]